MLITQYSGRRAAVIPAVLMAVVIWTVLSSDHGPGHGGRGTLAAALLAIGLVAYLTWVVQNARGETRAVIPALFVLSGSGGLLLAVTPDSAASALVFVAVIGTAMRSDGIAGWSVVAAGALGLAAGTVLYAEGGIGFLAYSLGFAAARLGASNARQSIARAEQAELLLAQAQRTQEEALRSARLQESARIAREIHDVLAHSLAGLTIQLEATRALIDQGAERDVLLARVEQAHQLARDGLRETRRAVGVLRDQPVPLGEALRALVAADGAAGEAAATLVITGDPAGITPRAGNELLRVAQESLTNVRKHAPGAQAEVTLTVTAREQVLTVSNTAPATRRASPLSRTGGGYGLRGMHERAELLGGTITAGPDGDGWRVELRIPEPG